MMPLTRGAASLCSVVRNAALWRGAHLPCLVPALLGGCTCASKHPSSSTREAAGASGDASDEVDASREWVTDGAEFSAPIGAARVGSTRVVAGLVAAEGVVRVKGWGSGGAVWTVDALRGVAWAPDAEVRLQPALDGVALLFHGLRGGKAVRLLAILGPRGESRGDPFEIGSVFCATKGGLAWIGPHAGGPTRVRARRWSDPETHDVVSVPPERDPSLVCGDTSVTVLGEGDDDLTATTFEPGDLAGKPPRVALRDADFIDEQREHDVYSNGDELGLVRVGASGGLALRELSRDGESAPWHKLKATVSADDDVVAVDGDKRGTLIVLTHDEDGTCPDTASSAERVRAVRWDRQTGGESTVELASADCEHARGPFWIAPAPTAPVVAWIERRSKLPAKTAPISGLSFRIIAPDGVHAGSIDTPADALVDAGCDEADRKNPACSVAALVRPADSDGMRPAPIRVFDFP